MVPCPWAAHRAHHSSCGPITQSHILHWANRHAPLSCPVGGSSIQQQTTGIDVVRALEQRRVITNWSQCLLRTPNMRCSSLILYCNSHCRSPPRMICCSLLMLNNLPIFSHSGASPGCRACGRQTLPIKHVSLCRMSSTPRNHKATLIEHQIPTCWIGLSTAAQSRQGSPASRCSISPRTRDEHPGPPCTYSGFHWDPCWAGQ